jgi:protein SCO1/2
MRTARPFVAATVFKLALVAGGLASVVAQETAGNVLNQVGFDQKLGVQLPLGLRFRDESSRELTLGDLFGRKPVVLVPVYYRCPMLCNQVLNGLTRSLRPLALDAGKDFDIVAFSIDPNEKSDLAAMKKSSYLDRYDRPGSEPGWHFLTGEEAPIEVLTRAIGFRYMYNPQTHLFAHAAGIIVVTPDGRIARYFYGIDYPAKELQAVLEQARQGRVGAPIGRLLLLCYDYDAATGKYTLSVLRLIRVLGTVTAVSLGSFVFVMFRRDRNQRCATSNQNDFPGQDDFSNRPQWPI